MRRIFALLLILRVSCPLARADSTASIVSQPYVWRNVKVGAGGFIPGIVFSRVEKGLAYLRSDMGGCYRWDNSERRWIPLMDWMPISSYFGGESIAPDPIDPNTVYVAAGMYRTDPAAMLRSHDRGKTWDIFPVSFHMGGNEDGRGVGERLAVDPNDNTILFFGSRNDGLWRSADSAQTWAKVAKFPIAGRGTPGDGQPSNTGLSFVVFDPRTGTRGSPTRTIFVGNADPGPDHLFRSDDAGATWTRIDGAPSSDMLPAQAQINDDGLLFITYGNGAGPNGITDGRVMKFDTGSRSWTDITPDKRPDRPKGGYCGISLDRQHPGTIGVATMNRWKPVDTVWRSTDGGKTWADIMDGSRRDVRASPFLLWGKSEAKLGWWMSALAIDPFDSNYAAYSTGATIYATDDFSLVSQGRTTHWYPWVAGIEQTAVITLASPPEGAHLLSAFGDIGGFIHDNLALSPAHMCENPLFSTTITLDFAGAKPSVVVRSGRPNQDETYSLGYSTDGGWNWHPIDIPALAAQPATGDPPAISVSADGKTFILDTPVPVLTRDRGKRWFVVRGLFPRARPIADRLNPSAFYAIDFLNRKLYLSTDGGANFKPIEPSGLPDDIRTDEPMWHEAPWPLAATPDRRHDLWLICRDTLYHSTDGGQNFTASNSSMNIESFSFGKAAPGRYYPAIFAIGSLGGIRGIWRSDDMAASWVRVNDDQHQYGTRFRCIAGDPRIFGRVYVGTDGRGILYGQPVGTRE